MFRIQCADINNEISVRVSDSGSPGNRRVTAMNHCESSERLRTTAWRQTLISDDAAANWPCNDGPHFTSLIAGRFEKMSQRFSMESQ